MIIRFATFEDAAVIHELIVALATYEREPDAVEATPASLAAQMRLPRPPFECLLAEPDGGGKALGFALFFHNYSTWRGRPGLYIEDLFVRPEHRRGGVGVALLKRLAALAGERGCARMEWAVLEWNQSAVEFYRRLGAVVLDEWRLMRLSGDALAELGAG